MSLRSKLISFSLMIFITSCTSQQVVINDTMTRENYFQKAQEAYDDQNYDNARAYYLAFLEKYSDDPAYIIMAEYELAFINYKTEKYVDAKAGFEAILDKHKNNPLQPYPKWTKVLSEKLLAEIEAQHLRNSLEDEN